MKSKIIITILLFIFSLYYLDYAKNFIIQNDYLMQEIERKQNNYNKDPINAIITNKMMIPGINGKKVNLEKSYKKMKAINTFNESLLVYDTIKPNKSINNIYDKIIIKGNPNNKKISIIAKINDTFLLNEINNILINNNIYIDILTNNQLDIENSNFQNIITTNYYSYTNYCLSFNLSINKECTNHRKYTILGNEIYTPLFSKTKEISKNGIILVYNFNNSNYQDLSLIIKYLKNNNYEIVPINELIKE